MSSSHYISDFCGGKSPFAALPVFASRIFRHCHIAVNRDRVATPKDLEGKRVGVPRYTQTAAVWIRGLLQHDYGVDLSTIQWVEGAMNQPGPHGHSAAPPPPGARVEVNNSGKSLNELIDSGAIDATLGTSIPPCSRTNPAVQRLFPNFRAVERDYYRRTKIFPIMHLVVIRRDVYEKNPAIASAWYEALEESRRRTLVMMRHTDSPRYMLPWLTADIEEIDEVFGGDPWPYGIEANRPTLEALVTYMADQRLIPKPVPVDDLFVVRG